MYPFVPGYHLRRIRLLAAERDRLVAVGSRMRSGCRATCCSSRTARDGMGPLSHGPDPSRAPGSCSRRSSLAGARRPRGFRAPMSPVSRSAGRRTCWRAAALRRQQDAARVRRDGACFAWRSLVALARRATRRPLGLWPLSPRATTGARRVGGIRLHGGRAAELVRQAAARYRSGNRAARAGCDVCSSRSIGSIPGSGCCRLSVGAVPVPWRRGLGRAAGRSGASTGRSAS